MLNLAGKFPARVVVYLSVRVENLCGYGLAVAANCSTDDSVSTDADNLPQLIVSELKRGFTC